MMAVFSAYSFRVRHNSPVVWLSPFNEAYVLDQQAHNNSLRFSNQAVVLVAACWFLQADQMEWKEIELDAWAQVRVIIIKILLTFISLISSCCNPLTSS
jgi:hypothetical protein